MPDRSFQIPRALGNLLSGCVVAAVAAFCALIATGCLWCIVMLVKSFTA